MMRQYCHVRILLFLILSIIITTSRGNSRTETTITTTRRKRTPPPPTRGSSLSSLRSPSLTSISKLSSAAAAASSSSSSSSSVQQQRQQRQRNLPSSSYYYDRTNRKKKNYSTRDYGKNKNVFGDREKKKQWVHTPSSWSSYNRKYNMQKDLRYDGGNGRKRRPLVRPPHPGTLQTQAPTSLTTPAPVSPVPTSTTPPPSVIPTGSETTTQKPTVSPTASATQPNNIIAGCRSTVAELIVQSVPQATVLNPIRCCSTGATAVGTGEPTAVFVTHAQIDNSTTTGFEPFWDDMYSRIAASTAASKTCFVMTGWNQTTAVQQQQSTNTMKRTLSEVLVKVNMIASEIPQVPAIMTTDPTDNIPLIQTIRDISDRESGPSIGVFNAGYNNIVVESLVTGNDRLPYVGYLDESEYGESAAAITMELLAESNLSVAVPLCFNPRLGTVDDIVGERCAAYYGALTTTEDEDEEEEQPIILPPFGVPCNESTTVPNVVDQLIQGKINSVLSHIDCCSLVAEAAERTRRIAGQTIIVGCTDANPATVLGVDFITTQPAKLQSYQSSQWVNMPVLQAQARGLQHGRKPRYFPSLQSLVKTDVYSVRV